MKTLFLNVVTPVWFLLMLATGVSWWLGAGAVHMTVAVMTIAYVKCLFVGMYFMELRHAPQPLRLAFLAWCMVGWTGILGFYLLG